jgi:hypothetical protein
VGSRTRTKDENEDESEMPVNTTHPEYDAALPAWLRARDVLAGEDAIKSAGERYLPRLESQTEDEYHAYRARASFYNATARSSEGFLGLVFRRMPFVKLVGQAEGKVSGGAPDRPRGARAVPGRGSSLDRAMEELQGDVDLVGTPLVSYAKTIVSEVLAVGRAGSLVDWEDTEGRAYVSRYAAEEILNWRMERIHGRSVLTLLALAEKVEGRVQSAQADEDEFEH